MASVVAILLIILPFLYFPFCYSNEEKDLNEEVMFSFIQEANLHQLHNGSCMHDSTICPPWTFCDSATSKCKCGKLPGDPFICDWLVSEEHASLRPYILDCYCVTTTTGKMTEVGQCNYNCARSIKDDDVDTIYRMLPLNHSSWNNYMCKEFNRSGTLCGQCDEESNYYPRAYSFNFSCIKCDGSWFNVWKYIFLVYVPLTVFFLIVFFLKLDINSSQLQGFIIFSQSISTPALARNILLTTKDMPVTFEVVKFLGTLYGFWNLDFFKTYSNGICFKISFLDLWLLDLSVAIYPLFLMLLAYLLIHLYDLNYKPIVLLWNPFQRFFSKWCKEFSVKTSLVNAFTTFLFLASSKFFSAGFDILTPVKVYQFNTPDQINTTLRLYYDSTVTYFSSEHMWYACIAIVAMLIFIVFPVLIMILYPFRAFHRFVALFPLRWQLSLYTLVDSFQGCYRDGTEPGGGTRDCRWYVPMLYLIRILFLVIYACTLNSLFLPFGAMTFTVIAIVTIVVDPFKSHLQHLVVPMVMFILFISVAYVSVAGTIVAKEASSKNSSCFFYAFATLLCLLPILYVAYIVLRWIACHWQCRNRMHQSKQKLYIHSAFPVYHMKNSFPLYCYLLLLLIYYILHLHFTFYYIFQTDFLEMKKNLKRIQISSTSLRFTLFLFTVYSVSVNDLLTVVCFAFFHFFMGMVLFILHIS